MPTVLDDVLETHIGPEPRVVTADVQRILEDVVRPKEEDGAAVELIAARAGVSTRTVYRVLKPEEYRADMGLDLADRLCLAAGSHIKNCRLIWPTGDITSYEVLGLTV